MAQRFFSVFLFLYWIATACGIGPSAQQEGSFDRRLERVHSSDAAIAAVQGKAEERLRQRVGTANVSNDPFSGSAKFVGSPQEFLTGPQGTGNALDAATLSAIPVTDEHRVVKAFLNEHRALFGHSADALSGARVDRDDKSAHNGMRTVVWHQMLEGIPVFDAILKSHVTAKGELVNIGSQFMSDPASAADKGSPNRSALLAAPPVSAAQALAIAAQRIGVDVQAEDLTATDNAQGAEKVQHFSNAKLLDPSARLTWFNLDPKTLRLCWSLFGI